LNAEDQAKHKDIIFLSLSDQKFTWHLNLYSIQIIRLTHYIFFFFFAEAIILISLGWEFF